MQSLPTCFCHSPPPGDKRTVLHHRRPLLIPCCRPGLGGGHLLPSRRAEFGKHQPVKGHCSCVPGRGRPCRSEEGTMWPATLACPAVAPRREPFPQGHSHPHQEDKGTQTERTLFRCMPSPTLLYPDTLNSGGHPPSAPTTSPAWRTVGARCLGVNGAVGEPRPGHPAP